MTDFIPPFSERTVEELIEISNSNTNHWQQEAIIQAKAELLKRGISKNKQEGILKEIDEEIKLYNQELEIWLENNKTESYKVWEMLVLFLFGPIIIIRPYLLNCYNLLNLKGDNYFLKFKQRIIIFCLSFISWYVYINYSYQKSEKQRLEEIEKIDITEWKKKYGYD
jgi:hypothetical protein